MCGSSPPFRSTPSAPSSWLRLCGCASASRTAHPWSSSNPDRARATLLAVYEAFQQTIPTAVRRTDLRQMYTTQTAELDEAGLLERPMLSSDAAGSREAVDDFGGGLAAPTGGRSERLMQRARIGDEQSERGVRSVQRLKSGIVWSVHRGVVVCVRRFCLAIHVKAMVRRDVRAARAFAGDVRRRSRVPYANWQVCSLCVLFEGTCGWVTGCAWTNFISVTMPSLDMYPTSPGGLFKVPYGVVLENASWSLMLTALAALWLTYVAEDPFAYDDNQKSDRAAVERFFITNAMCAMGGRPNHGRAVAARSADPRAACAFAGVPRSYFVGWAWIRELQDLYTILGSMIGQPFGRPVWGQVPRDYPASPPVNAFLEYSLVSTPARPNLR
jgi:hypothetical protein